MSGNPEFLLSLSAPGRIKLLGLLELNLASDQLQDYRAYPRQLKFHNAGASFRNRMLSAGNQQGKTFSAGAEIAMHLTGEYPWWWKGLRFDKPIVCWAASKTGEATRDNVQRILLGQPKQLGTGMIPKRCLVPSLSGMARGVTGLYDFMYVKHVSGGMSMLKFRYYTQDREAWQGPPVDVVWFDEEPPVEIYEEGLARTIATQGSTMLSFTPLLGYTQVVNQYMKDPDPEHSGRHWTRMTINDAQHLTAEEREREIARWPKHQRTARIEGLPAMGVGQIFAYEAEEITIDPFQIPAHWPLLGALDVAGSSSNPRAHPTAAVKIAWDRDNDCVYMMREYRKKALKPPEHWMALRYWGKDLRWAWPKDAVAEEKGTGSQIMMMYRSEGMKALPMHAQYPKPPKTSKNDVNANTSAVSVERGIMDMQTRFEKERLKIFSNCPMILEEIRQYHRDDKGKVVKEMDDLLDALRYSLMMLRLARLDQPLNANVLSEDINPLLGF